MRYTPATYQVCSALIVNSTVMATLLYYFTRSVPVSVAGAICYGFAATALMLAVIMKAYVVEMDEVGITVRRMFCRRLTFAWTAVSTVILRGVFMKYLELSTADQTIVLLNATLDGFASAFDVLVARGLLEKADGPAIVQTQKRRLFLLAILSTALVVVMAVYFLFAIQRGK